jgi:hypothetical protein
MFKSVCTEIVKPCENILSAVSGMSYGDLFSSRQMRDEKRSPWDIYAADNPENAYTFERNKKIGVKGNG